jgi:hypothetical protein
MPTLSLKKGTIVLPNGQSGDITTAQIVDKALDSAPADGLTIAEIRTRIKLDAKIAAAGEDAESVELSIAEFETLAKAIEPVRFIGRAEVIDTLVSELFPEPQEAEFVELSAV